MRLEVRRRSLLLLCSRTVLLGGSCFVASNLATDRLLARGDRQGTPFVLLKDGYSYETDPSGSLHMKFITHGGPTEREPSSSA
jgi:hypothetical protein